MRKLSVEQALAWVGFHVEDVNGRRVGRVEGVLVDRESGRPQWLLLRGGTVRAHHHAIPIAGVTAGAGHLYTPHTKGTIERLTVPADGWLSPRTERELVDAYRCPFTRGSQLPRWERRATSARVVRDEATGEVGWAPRTRAVTARPAGERRKVEDRSLEAADRTLPRPVPPELALRARPLGSDTRDHT